MTKTFNIKNTNTEVNNNNDDNLITKNTINNEQETNKKSNNLILPYTGFANIVIVFGIIALIIFMIINLVKYKKYNIK